MELTTEQKLQIRELQFKTLQTANLRMQLKIEHDELSAKQTAIEQELSSLIESLKPKEGKWNLQEDLTWKEVA